jgi:hypothetical protein
VIDYNAFPFEGCTFRKWTVTHDSKMYSSGQEDRAELVELKAGEGVMELTGVHITRKPDRFLVTQPIPALSLNVGDVILQYTYWGEWVADLWAKDMASAILSCND